MNIGPEHIGKTVALDDGTYPRKVLALDGDWFWGRGDDVNGIFCVNGGWQLVEESVVKK